MTTTAARSSFGARPGAALSLLRDVRRRRRAYAVAAAVLALLCLFPRQYVARAKILPQDADSAGLSAVMGALGGGFQNFASLLGARQSIDVYLTIARSNDVADDVIRRLRLEARYGGEAQAHKRLEKKVDVHSLMGGVIEVEAHDADRAFSQQLVTVYSDAIRRRLADLGRQHTSEKKAVVTRRLGAAATRLASAQSALSDFRRANHLAAPEAQLGAAVTLKTQLEAQLQAKTVELQTAQRFGTSENMQVKAIVSDIAGLRRQIAASESPAAGDGGAPNLAKLAEKSTEYLNLYREQAFAQALYEVYTRYLEGIIVEDLVANTNSNVQLIENPYIDPHWRINMWAAGSLAALALLAFYTEYYAPLTRLALRRSAA